MPGSISTKAPKSATLVTLLARAKVHPSVAQKILRHANIETTLAIYTHVDGIEDMRAAVAKLDFGPLAERTPAPVVPLRKTQTFATNLLPPIEQLLTVRQVARLLGVCPATVYKWTAQGLLAHVRIVNVIRVRPNDLTRFVAERARSSADHFS